MLDLEYKIIIMGGRLYKLMKFMVKVKNLSKRIWVNETREYHVKLIRTKVIIKGGEEEK